MNQQQFNPNLPPGSTPGAPNYYAAAPNAQTQPYNQPQAAFGTAQQPAATEPDLKNVETMGNGTLVKHYKDGRKSTVHPDGRTETVWPDGSTETVNPDGTKYHYTPTVPKEDYLDKGMSQLTPLVISAVLSHIY